MNNETRTIDFYEDALKIDKDDISKAIINQSQLYLEVCRCYNEAKSNMDTIKFELDQMEKHLSHKVRLIFERDKVKTTEGKIAEEVAGYDDFENKSYDLLDAKKIYGVWDGLKEAYIQRSLMLRELARIYISDTYMDPSVLEANSKKATHETVNRTKDYIKRRTYNAKT